MINQVKNLLLKRNLLRQILRQTHNDHPTPNILYPLKSRKLLKVAGPEAEVFLQGLITNDMRHLQDGAKSMYAMFLNNKGRVLYDTLIHRNDKEDSFLVECDEIVIGQLQRHLRLFKLKRKVEIQDASAEFKLWALIAPPNTVSETSDDSRTATCIYKDPRLSDLGYRVLSPVSKEGNLSDLIGTNVVIEESEKGYRHLRYRLGVSEGAQDLPPGTTFPLEVNCDYLHGVSFHKGCYIGQEVTARVHHTGVVRKRMMPLRFKENVEGIETDSVIKSRDNPKSNLGKLKGFVDNHGLGLVRIKEAMEAKALIIAKYSVEVIKPSWWPIEAPKEKATLNKIE